jgi:catechol 2,3-dioxygenase-like lactoylglutathione lyase family enzyme
MSDQIQRVIPTFRITNYEKSKHYYVEVLGFTIEWEHRFNPNFPVFMSIVRDGMQIYLSQHQGDCQVGGLIHFLIPDVNAWFEEFTGRNALVGESPNDDLGFCNMTIKDPDGNQLRFMEPSPKQANLDE